MARLATAQRERGARGIGEHDGIVIEAAVRNGQHVRVIGSLVATLERHKTVGRDDGSLVSPSLGKRQLVILERLVFGTGGGHVECRMTAHRERQGHVAGVGDGKGLRERGVAGQGIGHVELKVERERLERLGRVSDLVRYRGAVLRNLDQLVLDDASESVARHLAGAGRRCRHVVAQHPTMGNRIGACLPQKAGSPCHRYSLPLRARLVSWAPMESMAAMRPPRLMVVTVDMLLPPIVNNGVEGYCPTLGSGVERQVQLLSNSVKVKPALRRAIDRIGRCELKLTGTMRFEAR